MSVAKRMLEEEFAAACEEPFDERNMRRGINLAEKYDLGQWLVYGPLAPIDFGWEFLSTVECVAQIISAAEGRERLIGLGHEPEPPYPPSWPFSLDTFMAAYANALNLARDESCWEGDFRDPPRVIWLPAENLFTYAFAWKQESNGDTFVVSPVPLSWLKEHVLR